MATVATEAPSLPGGFVRDDEADTLTPAVTSPPRSKRPQEDIDGDVGLAGPAKRARTSFESTEALIDELVPDTPPRVVAPLPDPDQEPRERSPPLNGAPNGTRIGGKSPAVTSPRLGSPPQNKATSPNSSPQSNSSTSSLDSLSGTGQRRVKVYRLHGEQWDDLGTGWCHIWTEPPPGEKVDEDDGPWIIVRSEESLNGDEAVPASAEEPKGETIWNSGMRSVIMLGAADADRGGYQKQQNTLIIWTEPDGTDMALSFASSYGCAEIWDFIEDVRRFFLQDTDRSPLATSTPSGSPNRATQPDAFLQMFAHGQLPEPTLANLPELDKLMKWASRTPLGREKLATLAIRSDFIRKLIPIMGEAEDLESIDDLHELCVIMQSLLLLNENTVFEYVLQDDVIFGVTSILEYDPEFPGMKASYTAYLSDPSRFREVVPIKDEAIKAKIHQIYRLQYLKDVVLARILDDATFSMLNSFVYFHQVDIVTHLQNNIPFLHQLFGLFGIGYGPAASLEHAPPPPSPAPLDRQRQGLLFLQQFCAMAKNLQVASRSAFFRQMAEKGLLRVIEHALAHPPFLPKLPKPLVNGDTEHVSATPSLDEEEHDVRGATVEILMTLIDHDPASVRGHSLRSYEKDPSSRTLMRFIVDLFHAEPDLGIKAQFAEAIRVLVQAQPEAGTLEAMQARGRPEDPEAEKFLQFFYDHCAEQLVKPLLDLPDPEQMPDGLLDLPRELTALCAHLCDHLCYFVAAHTFRSKFFLLSSPVSGQVTRLMRTKQKHLRLSALRYLRACLGKNDEYWSRNLVKNDLLRPVLDLTVAESGRDNLLLSACLDFFEHVRTSNNKLVLNHLLDIHGDRIRKLAEHQTTFQGLITRWEQNNEPRPGPAAAAATAETGQEDKAGSIAAGEPSRAPPSIGAYGSANTRTLDAEEESYFNDSSEDSDDELRIGPSLAPTTSSKGRKREAEEQTSRKRQRTDHKSAVMVRSPAVVFQEMRLKGQLPNSRGLRGLVNYADAEEEEVDELATAPVTTPDQPSSDPPPLPPEPTAVASPPPPLSEPPPRRRDEEEQDALGLLGSGAKKPPLAPVSTAATATAIATTTAPVKKPGGLKISFKAR